MATVRATGVLPAPGVPCNPSAFSVKDEVVKGQGPYFMHSRKYSILTQVTETLLHQCLRPSVNGGVPAVDPGKKLLLLDEVKPKIPLFQTSLLFRLALLFRPKHMMTALKPPICSNK